MMLLMWVTNAATLWVTVLSIGGGDLMLRVCVAY
jgi:hypothetical protein